MPNISVHVNGSEKENVASVSIGTVGWGGAANAMFQIGDAQALNAGTYTVTVNRSTNPTPLTTQVQIFSNSSAVHLTVTETAVTATVA
jgi:hypothetical protein